MAHPTHDGPSPVLLSRKQARRLDRLAVEEFAMPSIVLMENAAIALARAALAMLDAAPGRRDCVIVCGPGNNGGDGFALARHLHNASVRVRLILSHPHKASTGDAAINLEIAQRMGLPIVEAAAQPGGEQAVQVMEQADLVVDALLGTGLDRPVTGVVRDLIETINRVRSPDRRVLAVDLPSGLDCDTGEALGLAVGADTTVTFAGLKPAMLNPKAPIGRIIVAQIGVPMELVARLGSSIPSPPEYRRADRL